jgi:DNA-binding Xre family transcriptional regulator
LIIWSNSAAVAIGLHSLTTGAGKIVLPTGQRRPHRGGYSSAWQSTRLWIWVSRVQIPLATPTSSPARYDVPMAVTWRVDELAERKGWNARRLAEKAGVDIKTARNILTGRATRVDLETIGRLADALGVEPGALWRRSAGTLQKDRWAALAGVAGKATKEEIDNLLRGDWDETTDSAFERATREL